jgi:hypothetical protein
MYIHSFSQILCVHFVFSKQLATNQGKDNEAIGLILPSLAWPCHSAGLLDPHGVRHDIQWNLATQDNQATNSHYISTRVFPG